MVLKSISKVIVLSGFIHCLLAKPVADETFTQVNILDWDEAYLRAGELVGQMSLEQKVNITTGLGWMTGACVGNTGRTSGPDFPELCLQDAPLGVRMADGVSSGVAGINAAASFDREAIRQRGEYMGNEFRLKGIHAQLGPAMNMLRAPEAGRNWEAFGEDPYLVGVASAETIKGIQSQGVVSLYIYITSVPLFTFYLFKNRWLSQSI